MIYKLPLASKHLSPKLEKVVQIVIKFVICVKTRPLKASVLARSCEEMGAEHISSISYFESELLSRGNVLK
jgi:hypothetical protein